MNLVLAFSEEKGHQSIIFKSFKEIVGGTSWNNVGISYTNISWILYDAFKLKADTHRYQQCH